LHYVDKSHPNFHKYQLPIGILEDPNDEEVMLAQLQCGVDAQHNVQLHNANTDTFANNDQDHCTSFIFDPSDSVEEDDGTISSFAEGTINEPRMPPLLPQHCQRNHNPNTVTYRLVKACASNIRQIDPVPFTGDNELFTPKITPEELDLLKDAIAATSDTNPSLRGCCQDLGLMAWRLAFNSLWLA
jgi:hypothetical protein